MNPGSHSEAERARILSNLDRLHARYLADGQERQAAAFAWAWLEVHDNNNFAPVQALTQLDPSKPFPVTIDEFLEDPLFLGYLKGDFGVWEAHQDRVRAQNPDVVTGAPPVHQVALGGGSGTGKTTLAWVGIAYQWYLLSCFRNPQRLFGLAPVTPIVFTMQSLSQNITKLVLYEPFKILLTSMPYVQKYARWDKNREKSRLDFEDNVYIIPALARGVSLQGQAVIGGVLDELAFMSVIESSKQVAGPRGEGGKFDQADEVYNETVNRRNRSFGTRGISIGSIFALSNTHYRGDFMDKHLNRIAEHKPRATIADRLRRHEVNPDDVKDVARGSSVRVLVGTDNYPTRLLEDPDETLPKGSEVVEVPQRYREEFLFDPDKALREIVGIASAAISPFFKRRDKVVQAFEWGMSMNLVPYVNKQDVDLAHDGMPVWDPQKMPNDRHVPRFIHVDLSKSRDRCGIAIIKSPGFLNMDDPHNPGTVMRVPTFMVECAITLTPSANAHVEPADVRSWLMELGDEYGFEIGGVSYDGFQSQESLQMWRRARVFARELSVDKKMEPYEYLRNAVYQGRTGLCESDILMEEFVMLEYNAEQDKVDHPPKGSKDVADAVCGAIYNCAMARSNRTKTGYYDQEDEKVTVRTRKDRPKGSKRPGGRKRRTKAAGQPAPVETTQEMLDAQGIKTVDPPKSWLDKHGGLE